MDGAYWKLDKSLIDRLKFIITMILIWDPQWSSMYVACLHAQFQRAEHQLTIWSATATARSL